MILYYQTGTGTSEPEIFVDFFTLKGMTHLPDTTLFRKLRQYKGINYRNRKLWKYRDLINTGILKELKKDEIHSDL